MKRNLRLAALVAALLAALAVGTVPVRGGREVPVRESAAAGPPLTAQGVGASPTPASAPVDAAAPGASTIRLEGSVDRDLRSLPPVPQTPGGLFWEPEFEPGEPPPPPKGPFAAGPDLSISAMPAVSLSFEGQSDGATPSGWPPDPVGDVGPSHYIQAINERFRIYSKTGTALTSSITFNTLWANVGTTACNGSVQSDPTVVFDKANNRWIMGVLAFTSTASPPAPPFYECIAVSKTGNPVSGGWWLYAVRGDDSSHPWLPDYPKMAVWPGTLLLTANYCAASCGKGARVWAFNLSDLISGVATPRRLIRDFPYEEGILPVNLRGSAGPTNENRAWLVGSGYTVDSQTALKVFGLTIDWPGVRTSATEDYVLPTSNGYYYLNGDSVPQPGTPARLDAFTGRLMMQAQYRNVGGVESIWVAQSVGLTSTGPTGVHWVEIRLAPDLVTTPVQWGIYGSTTGPWRWMPSLAVDRMGNMAVGYSVSGSSVSPSLRFAGRLVTDPLGTLAQGEASLVAGAGAQVVVKNSKYVGRWGDYAAMTVDPVDDCTFWFTGEYIRSYSGTYSWSTRIGTFRFPSCVAAPAPAISSFTPTSGGTGTAITITGSNFTSPSTCTIGTQVATLCRVLSPTTVITSVPASAGSGKVKVTPSVTAAGSVAQSTGDFTYLATATPPTVTSFAPTEAARGAVVTISGANLAGATSVKVGSITATSGWTVLSASQLTIPVPSTATSGTVAVTTAGGTGTGPGTLTVFPPPTLTSFTPAQVVRGGTVTISGTGFSTATSVAFDGGYSEATSFTVVSDTAIIAVVPDTCCTDRIRVTTRGGTVLSTASFYSPYYQATQVTAGASHSCARNDDGTIACWGLNANGQLGDGTLTNRRTAQTVKASAGVNMTGAASVAAGAAFTCAVFSPGSSGYARCWGSNANGQLGDGTQTQRAYPVRVLAAAGTNLVGVKQIATGAAHACALMSSGVVRCWGANGSGQLGDGTQTQRPYPVTVTVSGTTALSGVVEIAAGGAETCARLSTGGVRCWGNNDFGQVGDCTACTTSFRTRPVQVTGLTAGVSGIAVGGSHACAALAAGGVRCWGRNDFGQLGDGTLTQRNAPVVVLGSAGVPLVGIVGTLAAGASTTCAHREWTLDYVTPTVCWGLDVAAPLVGGVPGAQVYPVYIRTPGGYCCLEALSLAVGDRHVLGVEWPFGFDPSYVATEVLAWGFNTSGQLGDDTLLQRSLPIRTFGFELS